MSPSKLIDHRRMGEHVDGTTTFVDSDGSNSGCIFCSAHTAELSRLRREIEKRRNSEATARQKLGEMEELLREVSSTGMQGAGRNTFEIEDKLNRTILRETAIKEQNEVLNRELKTARIEMLRLQKENKEMEQRLAQVELTTNMGLAYEETKTRNNNTVADLENRLNEANKQISVLSLEKQRQKTEFDESMESMEEELGRCRSYADELQNMIARSQLELEKTCQEKENVKRELNEIEYEYSIAREKLNEYSQQLRTAQSMSHVTKDYHSREIDQARLKIQNLELAASGMPNVEKRCEDLIQQCNTATSIIAIRDSQIQSLREQLSQLRHELTAEREESVTLQTRANKAVAFEHSQRVEQQHSFEAQIDTLRQQIKTLREERDSIAEAHDQKIMEMKDKIKQYKQQNRSLSSHSGMLSSTMKSLQKELDDLRETVAKQTEEFRYQREDSTHTIMASTSAVSDMKILLDREKLKLEAAHQRIEILEKEVSSLRGSMTQLVARSSEEVAAVLSRETEANIQRDLALAQLQQLTHQLEEQQQHMFDLEDAIEQVENRAMTSDHQCQMLQTECQQLHEALQVSKSHLSQTNSSSLGSMHQVQDMAKKLQRMTVLMEEAAVEATRQVSIAMHARDLALQRAEVAEASLSHTKKAAHLQRQLLIKKEESAFSESFASQRAMEGVEDKIERLKTKLSQESKKKKELERQIEDLKASLHHLSIEHMTAKSKEQAAISRAEAADELLMTTENTMHQMNTRFCGQIQKLEAEMKEMRSRGVFSPQANHEDGETLLLLRANQAEENLVQALNQIQELKQKMTKMEVELEQCRILGYRPRERSKHTWSRKKIQDAVHAAKQLREGLAMAANRTALLCQSPLLQGNTNGAKWSNDWDALAVATNKVSMRFLVAVAQRSLLLESAVTHLNNIVHTPMISVETITEQQLLEPSLETKEISSYVSSLEARMAQTNTQLQQQTQESEAIISQHLSQIKALSAKNSQLKRSFEQQQHQLQNTERELEAVKSQQQINEDFHQKRIRNFEERIEELVRNNELLTAKKRESEHDSLSLDAPPDSASKQRRRRLTEEMGVKVDGTGVKVGHVVPANEHEIPSWRQQWRELIHPNTDPLL